MASEVDPDDLLYSEEDHSYYEDLDYEELEDLYEDTNYINQYAYYY